MLRKLLKSASKLKLVLKNLDDILMKKIHFINFFVKRLTV